MQTDWRKIKQKINWPQVTKDAGVCRAQLIGARVLSNLLSMHRWARGPEHRRMQATIRNKMMGGKRRGGEEWEEKKEREREGH